MRPIHNYPVAVMALAQTLFIGVALTSGLVKSFEDILTEGAAWNPAAVRHYGMTLLLVPITWTILCLLMERNNAGGWTRGRTIFSGIFVLAALCGFLGWTAMNPYFSRHPVHIVPMGG